MDQANLIKAAFDVLMTLTLVALAWRTLTDRDLFRATITFIALGLLIAITWVRLRAPDVALAEAAIGSGLTGALVLAALARMRRRELGKESDLAKEHS